MSSVELLREAMDELLERHSRLPKHQRKNRQTAAHGTSGRPPDAYPPEQSNQGGLRPPAEPPQADKAAIGLQGLVGARWGLHGSNWAPRGALMCLLKPTRRQLHSKGCPFCVPRVIVGVLANEILGLRRCCWAAASHQGGTESSI